MKDEKQEISQWETYVKQVLKDEIKRNLESYESLAKKFNVPTGNIRNKVNRGTFSAAFFFEALSKLGVKQVDIPDPVNYDKDSSS